MSSIAPDFCHFSKLLLSINKREKKGMNCTYDCSNSNAILLSAVGLETKWKVTFDEIMKNAGILKFLQITIMDFKFLDKFDYVVLVVKFLTSLPASVSSTVPRPPAVSIFCVEKPSSSMNKHIAAIHTAV